MIQKLLQSILLLLFILFLSACANKSLKVAEPEPAELSKKNLSNSALTKLWSIDVGNSSKKDNLRLEMVGDESGSFYTVGYGGELYKLTNDGKKLWKVDVMNKITSGVAVGNKTVVVVDDSARVHAYSSDDGTEVWQRQLSSSVLAPALVTGQRVILLSNSGLITGLNRVNGNVVWQFKVNSPAYSLRGTSRPVLLSKSYAAVTTADGRIHAFTVEKGLPMWVRSVALSSGKSDFDRLMDVDADAVFYKMKLYTVSFQSHLVAIDMKTRAEMFQKRISSTKTPEVIDDKLIVVDTDGKLFAFDNESGKKLWEQTALTHRKLSNAVVIKNKVFVGDYKGYIHELRLDTGEVVSRVRDNGHITVLKKSAAEQLISISKSGSNSLWQVQ